MCQETEFLISPNFYLLRGSHLGAPTLPLLQAGTWEPGLDKHITNRATGLPEPLCLSHPPWGPPSPEATPRYLDMFGGVNTTKHVPAPPGSQMLPPPTARDTSGGNEDLMESRREQGGG